MKGFGERYDEVVEELAKRTYKYRYELYDKILGYLSIQRGRIICRYRIRNWEFLPLLTQKKQLQNNLCGRLR
jgi:hypothetical protein